MADTDILLAQDGSTSYHRWLYDAGNGLYSIQRVDHSTQATLMLDYEHHELHEGNHYFLAATTTLDSASTDFLDIGILTANTTTWANMAFSVSSVGQTTFTVYEGAALFAVSDGTAITPINNNRNSANTSAMTLVSNPAYTAAASDQLFQQVIGADGGAALIKGGLIDRNKEIILKQNTYYIFRMDSGSSANLISYTAEWYEHADKA